MTTSGGATVPAACAAPADGSDADAWLAQVAHEMRTPLHAILGYAQLLQLDSAPDSPQARAAQVISAAGQHLLCLASDLLDRASLQAGSFMLRDEAFPLPRLFGDVADMVRIAARGKGLSFHCMLAPPLPTRVVADEARLRQVLLNLLANAVKFTRQGGVALEVRGELRHGARWVLHFEVSDTGIGIPAEEMAQLFMPYVRLDTGAATGTGLGLSISRELVRAMGSDIQVSSRPGGGTRFAFAINVTGETLAPGGR